MKLFFVQTTQDDVVTERETYQTTREGLEQMYSESQKRLKDEIRNRQVQLLSFASRSKIVGSNHGLWSKLATTQRDM